MRKKVAWRAVGEQRHLPCPGPAQDIPVEEEHRGKHQPRWASPQEGQETQVLRREAASIQISPSASRFPGN